MNRIRTIDLCRELLFIFMMSTHALSIAGVPSAHWLFSDFWLPNGWATLVFVVLAGYGVGFLFSMLAEVHYLILFVGALLMCASALVPERLDRSLEIRRRDLINP